MADSDVSKMKVADLKHELKIRGLTTTGNKNELVQRLQAAIIEGDVFDETGISEEGLLEGDEVLNDDELDEEASLLNSSTHDEDIILKSPTELKSINLTSNVQKTLATTSIIADAVPHKKIILKRKAITEIIVNDDIDQNNSSNSQLTETKIAKIDSKTDSESDSDKGTVKVTQLTAKERLELRAKKFGATPTGDVLKQVRAERFGINKNSENEKKSENSGKLSTEGTAVSLDVLKKRAERFGTCVSTVLNKIENAEKLKKRQERFNAGNNNSETSPIATDAAIVDPKLATDYAEKAKLRAERFKTSA